MVAGFLFEGSLVEGYCARGQARPGDAVRYQKMGEPITLERRAVEYLKVAVDLGNEAFPDGLPMLDQSPMQRGVDRDAGAFHTCDRRHITPAQERPRHVDRRFHDRP